MDTELQLQLNLEKWLGKHLPRQIGLNYLYNNLEKKDANFISNYVLDNIKHKFVGSVNYEIVKHMIFDLKITFQDRAGTYTVFENGNYGMEKSYPAFWIFDGKLSYSFKALNVYCSVNNLFDRNFYDLGNVPQPGRWIKAGIAYRFSSDN